MVWIGTSQNLTLYQKSRYNWVALYTMAIAFHDNTADVDEEESSVVSSLRGLRDGSESRKVRTRTGASTARGLANLHNGLISTSALHFSCI